MAPRSPIALLRLLAVTLLLAMLAASPSVAQDDDDDHDDDHGGAQTTAVAGDDDDDHGGTATATAGGDDRLGGWLHAGTCDQIGDPVEDLEDLGDDDRDDGDDDDERARVWQRIGGDAELPDPFWGDDDDIDLTLDSLTAGDHVITVHETGSADSPVLACGAVSGERDERGGLLLELEEVDNSGYEGRAYLIADADDDGDDDEDDDADDDGTEIFLGIWEVQPAGV